MSAHAHRTYRATALPAKGDTITVTAYHEDGGTSEDVLTVTRVGSIAGWGTLPNGEEVMWRWEDTTLRPLDPASDDFVAVVASLDALIAKHPEAAAMLATVAEHRARITTYPALIEVEVEDDGETYDSLRCPWCDNTVTDDETLILVDVAERWTRISSDEFDMERHNIEPDFSGHGDYESLYYMHETCGRPVDLPEGWNER